MRSTKKSCNNCKEKSCNNKNYNRGGGGNTKQIREVIDITKEVMPLVTDVARSFSGLFSSNKKSVVSCFR